ncbi:MAG: hypothetical protein OQK82_09260 [Candidatus Pacearchaeota archaeon]|nr:hypothetical protein [Candidatus Pacearchaeota archaeon]
MMNKLFLLTLGFLCLGRVAAGDVPTYYAISISSDEYVSRGCEVYLSNHVDSILNALDDIALAYSNMKWMELNDLITSVNYRGLVVNLRYCSSAYRFNGVRDYFDESYSLSILLESIFELAIKDKKSSKSNVVNLIDNLKEDLKTIKISKKVKSTRIDAWKNRRSRD